VRVIQSFLLLCDAESLALVDPQKASLEHLARHSGLTLKHMTPGTLQEHAVHISNRFLSHARDQLKKCTRPYDEISAPPEKMFEILEKAHKYFSTINTRRTQPSLPSFAIINTRQT
jgi:hypothetical protein